MSLTDATTEGKAPGFVPMRGAVDRFWSRVDRSAGLDGCWPWTACRHPSGYGHTTKSLGGGYAHRAAYQIATGQDPRGMVVRHTCDNPPCCNPAHLRIGTVADNARDREERGRHPHSGMRRGSSHPRTKLTEEKVRASRERRAAGESIASLAACFGVSHHTMSVALRGMTWKHVDDAPQPAGVGGRASATGRRGRGGRS